MTTGEPWALLRQLFAPRVEALASGYAQQVLTRLQQKFLGVLGPQTQAVVADTFLDAATLNSKYA